MVIADETSKDAFQTISPRAHQAFWSRAGREPIDSDGSPLAIWSRPRKPSPLAASVNAVEPDNPRRPSPRRPATERLLGAHHQADTSQLSDEPLSALRFGDLGVSKLKRGAVAVPLERQMPASRRRRVDDRRVDLARVVRGRGPGWKAPVGSDGSVTAPAVVQPRREPARRCIRR
jgi:hypothetical protein